MAMQYTRQHFFDNTNGGLDYILKEYPNGSGVAENRNFKIDSNDDTPSGRIKCKQGVYYFYDYRADKTGRNAVDLCMHLHSFEFYEALEYLYKTCNVATLEGKSSLSAKWHQEYTHLPEDHNEIEYLDKPANLKTFAPFLKAAHCKAFNFESVQFYEFVSWEVDKNTKERTGKKKLNRVNATDEYPIFAFVEADFVKIYEPFATKAHRFRFFGKKPHDFIYGWDSLLEKVDIQKIEYLRDKIKDSENAKELKSLREELNDELLDKVLIASGGSDGLNIASLGYNVIWFNSESEQISYEDYSFLKSCSKGVYNVPDLDATGVKQAVKLGLDYLDLKTVWLPLDFERTKRKDFRDWIATNKSNGGEWCKRQLGKLMENALAFKWWEWNKGGSNYKYNYVNLIYFLEHQGFYVHKIEHRNAQKGKIENIFIKIDGHVAHEVHPSEIKVFLQDWLKAKQIKLQVRNMVIGSRGINSEQLLSLPRKPLDYRLATRTTQYFFFNNKAVLITPDEIKEVKADDLGIIIWDNKVVNHNIILDKQPQLNVYKDTNCRWRVKVNEKNNKYLNYLINASRVHWRKELEEPFGKDTKAKEAYHEKHRFDIAGPNLNEEEQAEQEHHLANKYFALGHMLHNFKNSIKPWAVVAIDNKIPDMAGESNGRSGKSLFIGKALEYLKNRVVLKGRDPRLTDNQFLYDEVTEDTEVIYIDDAHYTMNYGHFFSEITGSTKVNKKHGLQFEIGFDKSPKYAVTTNYLPLGLDASTIGRMLLTVFSDYYHVKIGDEYLEDRNPGQELGGNILESTSPPEEFNLFYNFCMQAIQFFMNCTEKIEPPAGNIQKRNYMQVMGDSFHEWAKSFFATDENGFSDHLNDFVEKRHAMQDYKNFVNGKAMTPQKWRKALDAYCKLQDNWQLNPPALLGSDGLIKRAVIEEGTGKRTMPEFFYINTTKKEVVKQGNNIVLRDIDGNDTPLQVHPEQPPQQLDMYDQVFNSPDPDPNSF